MNKVIKISIVVILSAILSGCVSNPIENPNEPATYVEEHGRGTLILYPDGEFVAMNTAAGTSYSGTYRPCPEGYILVFRPFGNVEYAIRNGTALQDKDGWRYYPEK